MGSHIWHELVKIRDMKRLELRGDVPDWDKSNLIAAERNAAKLGIDWDFDPGELDLDAEAERIAEEGLSIYDSVTDPTTS